MTEGDVQSFDVIIRSFNRSPSIERVSIRNISGHWRKAILVELYDKKKPRTWTTVDKEFPRINGHLDV